MSGKGVVNQRTPSAAGVHLTQASQGVPIAVVYGRCRVPGNIIWIGSSPDGFANLPSTTLLGTTVAIDGGFGGQSGPTQPQANYFVSGMWGLCEGPIVGVRTLYKRELRFVINQYQDPTTLHPGKHGPLNPYVNPPVEEFYVQSPDGTIVSFNLGLSHAHIFRGAPGQPGWTDDLEGSLTGGNSQNTTTWIFNFRHPTPVLTYPYLAYLARHAWPLYGSAELPNLNFEVFGLCLSALKVFPIFERQPNGSYDYTYTLGDHLSVGCNPADIIPDMLTNAQHGIDFPATMLGTLSDYRTAATANGWILNIACISQQPTQQYIQEILDQSNATIRFSQGLLTVLPLDDGAVTGPDWADPTLRQTYLPPFIVADGRGGYTAEVVSDLRVAAFECAVLSAEDRPAWLRIVVSADPLCVTAPQALPRRAYGGQPWGGQHEWGRRDRLSRQHGRGRRWGEEERQGHGGQHGGHLGMLDGLPASESLDRAACARLADGGG